MTQGAETTDAMMATLSGVTYPYPYTAVGALGMLGDLYTEGFTAFG